MLTNFKFQSLQKGLFILALLVGIDRFMSECRSLTNLIGNGVATVVISRWENEITPAQLRAHLCR